MSNLCRIAHVGSTYQEKQLQAGSYQVEVNMKSPSNERKQTYNHREEGFVSPTH